MTTNKYFKIAKKTTIDYIENKISALEFTETFKKLNEINVYKNLENNGYKNVSNFISAIQELDDQNTLDSQTIVNVIDLFYCYFINNYDYVYAKNSYKFLKIGLNKENKNPIRISFNKAIESYFKKEISHECLGYIANEFLKNLKFFKKEINKDKELFNTLTTTSKLKFNKILEDLTPQETQTKQTIDNSLKSILKK